MILVDNLVALCQTYINSISNRVEPSDWYTFITSAIREVRRGRTFPSQRRNSSIDVYSGIFTYNLPTDFSSFIKPHDSLFEQSDQGPYMVYGRDKDFFANNKYGLALTQNANNKYLMIRRDGLSNLALDTFDETDISTYTASDDASNLLSNNYNYIEGSASLQFDITNVTGSSVINKVLPGVVDISEFVKFGGKAFINVYMPVAFGSISLRLTSSLGNYYTTTASTTTFVGTAFAVGWNQIAIDLQGMTETGTVDDTAIANYDIIIDNSVISGNGFLLDALYLRLPQKMELPYNSKYVVTDNAGTAKEAVTEGSDYVLIDEDYEEMIAYKAVEHGAKWKFGDADVEKMAAGEYNEAYKEFSRRFPSVEASVQSSYYKNNRF
jgi:hypothetical protein